MKNRMCWLLLFLLILTGAHGSLQVRENCKTTTSAKKEVETDPVDIVRQYTFLINENYILKADSIQLEERPLKGQFHTLYKDDRIVVAEIGEFTGKGDTLRIKLARDQETQGWINAQDFFDHFVPTDLLSQVIYLLRNNYTPAILIIFSLFCGWLTGKLLLRKKDILFVYFNDIDSSYPLLLCLITAYVAGLYETIQLFYPDKWQLFYMNPTFNPLEVPLIIGYFLIGIWLTIILILAVLEVCFRQLSIGNALFHLCGIFSASIFTYFFFIITTHYYIGYLFLLLFTLLFVKKAIYNNRYRYQCGHCYGKMRDKAVCPHCGAINI